MNPFQPNTGTLPPALRALALGLLVETVGPLLNDSHEDSPLPPGQGEMAEFWQTLRCKCGELSALVLRADDPRVAATYVLDYLPRHFEYVFELIHGQKRRPVLGDPKAEYPVAHRNGEEADPA
jgi:hypothetical protein